MPELRDEIIPVIDENCSKILLKIHKRVDTCGVRYSLSQVEDVTETLVTHKKIKSK